MPVVAACHPEERWARDFRLLAEDSGSCLPPESGSMLLGLVQAQGPTWPLLICAATPARHVHVTAYRTGRSPPLSPMSWRRGSDRKRLLNHFCLPFCGGARSLAQPGLGDGGGSLGERSSGRRQAARGEPGLGQWDRDTTALSHGPAPQKGQGGCPPRASCSPHRAWEGRVPVCVVFQGLAHELAQAVGKDRGHVLGLSGSRGQLLGGSLQALTREEGGRPQLRPHPRTLLSGGDLWRGRGQPCAG